jgi:hypothetical protein
MTNASKRLRKFGWILTGLVSIASIFAGPTATRGADPPPTTDELLGLSRYLSDDTGGYISLVSLGRLRQTLAESQAWRQIEAVPEVGQAVGGLKAVLSGEGAPPEARLALDLLKAAGTTEITLATSAEVSRELLSLARALMLSVAVFAPSPHAPGSPQAAALEAKRAPLRAQWLATVPSIRIPSLVVAARVREPAKYEPFVRAVLEQGRQAALAEIGRGAPPEVQAVLAGTVTTVTLGKSQLHRFHLRLGDILPPELIVRSMRGSPIGENEQIVIASALANLTLNVHLGFVGEYLTLAVSSDDAFMRQIIDRFEGKTAATLAASANFAPIRAELKPDALGLLYGNAAGSMDELRAKFLPLLNSLTDEEFLGLVGAPAEIMPAIRRLRYNLDAAVYNAPLRQHAVLTLDRGLRQFVQSEYDREPVAAATAPMTTPGMIPATAVGYTSWRFVSLEGLWQQIRFQIEQRMVHERYVMNIVVPGGIGGRDRDMLRQAEDRYRAMLKPIDEKLAPSLQGETALVAGGFTPFAWKQDPLAAGNQRGPVVRDFPIPTAALIMRSPKPDVAIEGLRELFQAVMAFVPSPAGPDGKEPPPPATLSAKEIDGGEAWVFGFRGISMEGIEPHLTRIGDAVVFSSSPALTKQLRETAAGRSPAIGTTARHTAMQELLPVGAQQLSYLDGEALNRGLRSTAASLFTHLEENRESLGITERDLAGIAQARQYVELGLNVVGCMRGAAASVVSADKTDVLREWIHVEDVKAP